MIRTRGGVAESSRRITAILLPTYFASSRLVDFNSGIEAKSITNVMESIMTIRESLRTAVPQRIPQPSSSA